MLSHFLILNWDYERFIYFNVYVFPHKHLNKQNGFSLKWSLTSPHDLFTLTDAVLTFNKTAKQ